MSRPLLLAAITLLLWIEGSWASCPVKMETGITVNDRKIYWTRTKSTSHAQAQAQCFLTGGQLIELPPSQIRSLVDQLKAAKVPQEWLWIGYERATLTAPWKYSLSGEEIQGGVPLIHPRPETTRICGYFQAYVTRESYFFGGNVCREPDGTYSFSSLCMEMPCQDRIYAGFTYANKEVYWTRTTSSNHTDAQAQCAKTGGRLIEVRPSELKFFSELGHFRRTKAAKGWYWTALQRETNQSPWRYAKSGNLVNEDVPLLHPRPETGRLCVFFNPFAETTEEFFGGNSCFEPDGGAYYFPSLCIEEMNVMRREASVEI